jgi:hypothetical protein
MAKVIEALGGDTAAIEGQLMSGSPHEKQPNVCGATGDDKPRVLATHDAN